MIKRFGQGYQTYTIKCGVNSVLKEEYRQRFDEGVNQLSLYTRKIIIRTQILVNTYLLQQDGDIPAICFEQQFFIQPCKLFKRVVLPPPTHTYQLSVYLRFGIACFQSIPSCRQQ